MNGRRLGRSQEEMGRILFSLPRMGALGGEGVGDGVWWRLKVWEMVCDGGCPSPVVELQPKGRDIA